MKEQSNNRPWLWKKGQSGNPEGRPPGRSIKERAKSMLASMTNEEFEDFLQGLDKKVIWEMAEGKAQQDITSAGERLIPLPILDVQENNGDSQDKPVKETN